MDKLFPFRGFRYDPSRVGDLRAVVTQPYDKISPDMLKRYLARGEYNVAHVIKNPDYSDAAQKFQSWIESGALVQDDSPSLYPYQQEFEIDGQLRRRLGLIGLVSLERAQDGVKGHESVLEAPLQDRLQLIRHTESNDGLIFSLYSDPARSVDERVRRHCEQNPPVADLVDDYGTRHTVWRLSDASQVEQVCRPFNDWTLYIADGHHRFETALRFAQECRDKGWACRTPECFDRRMMALFNMDSEGLTILPTHRAVRDLTAFDSEAFLRKLRKNFRVTRLSGMDQLPPALSGDGQRLGVVLGDPPSAFLITPEDRLPEALESLKGPARELDVNLLHRGILEPLLGIGAAEIASEKHVDYFRDREAMLEGVRERRYQLGFVLNPTSLDQVRAISERGERMPQKSTDFYPKLLTGLVFMKMEIWKPVRSSRS